MSAAPKLTKKQKKSLAFRERKAKPPIANDRKKHKNELTGNDDDALLALEGEDIFGLDGGEAEAEGDAHAEDSAQIGYEEGHALQYEKGKGGGKGKSKKESEDVPVFVADLKGKKRKREGEGGVGEEMRQDKVKKAKQTSPVEEKNDKAKQKFILFVGNLKYTTTKETIAQHFALCDPPPTVRLLTPKVKSGSTQQQKLKSKGCAFLEFSHRNALQQALKLHQSTLEGRSINVELTAGGGGKCESRLAKVRERNKALLGQREKRTSKEGESEASLPTPQRFSTTSGLLQKPIAKRTWTVGDTDDGQVHRGGERHKKRSRQKTWGTGVNAIPVG